MIAYLTVLLVHICSSISPCVGRLQRVHRVLSPSRHENSVSIDILHIESIHSIDSPEQLGWRSSLDIPRLVSLG
jgi:hypothetical protein